MILPVALQKEVNHLLTHALPLCILYRDDRYENLILENYLSPYGYVWEDARIEMGYFDCYEYGDLNHIDTRVLSFSEIAVPLRSVNDGITNTIKKMTDEQYYTIIFLDEYYLPLRNSSASSHFVHEFLIYGYEGDRISAIAFNRDMAFSHLEFFDRDVDLAYRNARLYIEERNECAWPKDKLIMFLRPVAREIRYPFRPAEIKKKLDMYMDGCCDEKSIWMKTTSREFQSKARGRAPSAESYGINTIDSVKKHMELYIDRAERGEGLPIGAYFHFIHMYKEQCGLAFKRACAIRDFYDMKSVLAELEKRMRESEIIRMQYLKCASLAHNPALQAETLKKILKIIA